MGQRLKEAREKANLTQTQLAHIVGVKPAEISQYESDKRTPRWNILIKIVDALGISSDYLIGREISVASDEEDYKISMAKRDLEIIEAIRNNRKLYKLLYKDPERNSKVIENNIKNVFPE